MATKVECSSDSEGEEVDVVECPRVVRSTGIKRRKILDCRNVVTVPVYSGRVNRTLKLYQEFPDAVERELQRQATGSDSEDDPDSDSESKSTPGRKRKRRTAQHSDSDEDQELDLSLSIGQRAGSPSPPSSPSTPALQTSRACKVIREADRNLKALEALRSPPLQGRVHCESDDVILVGVSPAAPRTPREITVKVRCRGHIYRVPMRMTDRLQKVTDYVADRLGVDSARLLMLLKDVEVLSSETPESQNISVADILDCFVLSAPAQQSLPQDKICLRVRGVEKNSFQLITIGKAESLKRLMDDYKNKMGLQRSRMTFHFDGTELLESSTPLENDMESEDVIDVRVCAC
ncbi:LOW QUALITY PROTEIN: NFATC2-interacting protein [Scyliorhinus torazame]|uniref:LOW QUALITY PROTEIN: NFATC2-interacting protein n=1 Tax=Scyliorhinus torazame TaxID=75743 RepID=UPI003B5BA60B